VTDSKVLTGSSSYLLLPILLAAAVLRLDGLRNRGLVYWDEGKFALEGIRLLSVLRAFPAIGATSIAGKAVGTAKPMHALFIAAAYQLGGVHDSAPLFLDASASIVGVAVLYLFTTDLFNRRVGLVAATLLAVSGYDLVYARSALSESDATLLYLVSVWLWWRAFYRTEGATATRLMLASGVALGAAFTTNYRISVYACPLAVFAILATIRSKEGPRRAYLTFIGGVATLMLPILWECIGLFARSHGVVLFRSEITNRPTTYWSEVVYQIHGGKQAAFRFDPLLYLRWYVIRQGWLMSILTVFGIVSCILRRTLAHRLTLSLVVAPFALFTFAAFIVPRNLDAMLPMCSILAALGLIDCLDAVVPRAAFGASLIVTTISIAIVCASLAVSLLTVRSGFVRAALALQRVRTNDAIIDDEVMEFYLRDSGVGCDGQRLPNHIGGLRADVASGARFAFVTSTSHVAAAYLAHHAPLIARFHILGNAYTAEDLISSENGLAPTTGGQEWISMYSLVHLRVPTTGRLHHVTCVLDRVV
jgi:4-amino-4-deoxy-L-arabinose transferase-like glycosyltransferase